MHTLQYVANLSVHLAQAARRAHSLACQQAAWGEHKNIHKQVPVDAWLYCTKRGKGRSTKQPDFAYTGSLRPQPIGPRRAVCLAFPAITVQHSYRPHWTGVRGMRATEGPPACPPQPETSWQRIAIHWLLGFCHSIHCHLQVPDSIPQPDWAQSGVPTAEIESRAQRQSEWPAAAAPQHSPINPSPQCKRDLSGPV